METKAHTLTIEADLDEIARSSAWAAEMAAKLDLPPSLTFAVDVCFEEAISNVILYGLKDAPPAARQVRLTMSVCGLQLRVVIEDRGVPFDPSLVDEPVAPQNLEEAKVGGLGIHLMRRFTSALNYERTQGVNRLTLEFPLQ